jgi:hypothetical protein
MNEQRFPNWRIYFTVGVMLAELAHITWEYFNGGVKSHHFLNLSDMPAISNWWGLLLLPSLTWFITGRIQKRMAGKNTATATFSVSIFAGFVSSLLFGILLSISFVNNYETIAELLFLGMFLLAFLLPIYRAECVLGFVLGMTFTFGVVLPTAIGSVIAGISATVHLLLYPFLVRLWTRVRRIS